MTSSPEIESEPSGGDLECPACGGSRVVKDHVSGEVICRDCGRVIRERSFDRGPEWRAFNQDEREEKSRGGPPETETIHNRGLSTRIDYRNRDARGKSLPPEKRGRVARMRKWNKMSKMTDSEDRTLSAGFSEINRLFSQLGLPDKVVDEACRIFREASGNDLIRGRSTERIASAVVSLSCRLADLPRTFSELAEVSSVGRGVISRDQKYIESELDISPGTLDPVGLINRFGSELDLSGEVRVDAVDLVRRAQEKSFVSGKSPKGLAAAVLYMSAKENDVRRTQPEVADACNITEVTLRNRYKEIREKLGEGVEVEEIGAGSIEVKDVEHENVVASVTFEDTEFDLEELSSALDSPNARRDPVRYDPGEFPGLTYYPEGAEATFLIFESGKADCVGATSTAEVREAVELLVERLADEGIDVGPPELDVANIVVQGNFGERVDLEELHDSSYGTTYAPSSFPGLSLEIKEPDASILLFASGKCVLHVDRDEIVRPAFERVAEILRDFVKR